jgi:hypothetical protein
MLHLWLICIPAKCGIHGQQDASKHLRFARALLPTTNSCDCLTNILAEHQQGGLRVLCNTCMAVEEATWDAPVVHMAPVRHALAVGWFSQPLLVHHFAAKAPQELRCHHRTHPLQNPPALPALQMTVILVAAFSSRSAKPCA